ncbi:HAMP domain-containing histidine kinase [Verrucomicrobiales bacterium]|nr:HAMP domain-containing histidine kinase [Verrucomicrobiales bacterium]
MNRPWIIWSILAGCGILILGMFGWMTQRALASEQERVDAQAAADHSERMRLALSRMDTIGANLLVVENQRPPLHYQAFFSPTDIFNTQLENLDSNEVLQSSPLLTERSPLVKLHFEFRETGQFICPQVPTASQRDLALSKGIDSKELDAASVRLAELTGILTEERRRELTQSAVRLASVPSYGEEENAWLGVKDNQFPQSAKRQSVYEQKLNVSEKGGRAKVLKKALDQAAVRSATANQIKKTQFGQLSSLTPFRASWIEGSLILIRKVQGSLSTKFQGVWLDHEAIGADLAAELRADVKGVSLVPLIAGDDSPLALVSLPYKLTSGAAPRVALPWSTPMRRSLLFAWLGAVVALAALFFLIRGVLALSERRAAFVSSVTHELRTPLTTFRLYSEMLADGMVPDEVTRKEYLRTMQGESERLNHLVENVLAYSQIERGTARSKFEKLPVTDLVERLRPVLQRRVDQEDAALIIEIDPLAGDVETDVTGVEQILFNLIDNACKYGLSESGQGPIIIRARREKQGLCFEVSDHGRGIRACERKRLFRAFHKSAQEAAHSKPGVGLGLALCRRLARALGGDLTIDSNRDQGACFILQLP